MNTHELWQAALGELELKLSKAHFTTWFRNTFIAEFGNDGVIGQGAGDEAYQPSILFLGRIVA